MKTILRNLTVTTIASALGVLVSRASVADTAPSAGSNVYAGRSSVYQDLQVNSLESLTTPDHIMEVAQGGTAPTEIWRALEHGEKVECLDCIPAVSNLLYDGNAKTREISAWWLRRRIFGVFGPGEVYSQVLSTLTSDTSETRRAYAASAIGEFLLGAGVAPVATAAVTDTSALVRTNAVAALERLNNEGPNGELGKALSDSSSDVRLAALHASVRINVFSGIASIASLLSDPVPEVRRRAAEVLGVFRSSDAVVGLIALTSPNQEADPRVRTAAVAALGKIADPSAQGAVQAATTDPDALVQSVATIALRRL